LLLRTWKRSRTRRAWRAGTRSRRLRRARGRRGARRQGRARRARRSWLGRRPRRRRLAWLGWLGRTRRIGWRGRRPRRRRSVWRGEGGRRRIWGARERDRGAARHGVKYVAAPSHWRHGSPSVAQRGGQLGRRLARGGRGPGKAERVPLERGACVRGFARRLEHSGGISRNGGGVCATACVAACGPPVGDSARERAVLHARGAPQRSCQAERHPRKAHLFARPSKISRRSAAPCAFYLRISFPKRKRGKTSYIRVPRSRSAGRHDAPVRALWHPP
jgi:hypothetical protein